MAYVILPNSGESLGFTRPQVRENFLLIQNVFDNNHYDFNAVNAGKHNVIQLPEQTTYPLTPVNEGQLLAREYNSKTELAWRPENTAAADDQYILSGMPIRAAARFNLTGVTSGLKFNINTVTVNGATNYDITFLTQFPIGAASGNYLVIASGCTITGVPFSCGAVSQVAAGFTLVTNAPAIARSISFIVLGG